MVVVMTASRKSVNSQPQTFVRSNFQLPKQHGLEIGSWALGVDPFRHPYVATAAAASTSVSRSTHPPLGATRLASGGPQVPGSYSNTGVALSRIGSTMRHASST